MRFEERELKPYAEPVNAQTLRQGEIYFSVQFADEEMLIPIMEAWVFAGRGLDAENHAASRLYFQDVDVESYRQGVRYDADAAEIATFQIQEEDAINHIFEYECALDVLMRCSLRRRQRQTGPA